MSDYTCPDCGGGFPTSAADEGACPWCGEAMNGESSDRPRAEVPRTPQPTTFPAPNPPKTDPEEIFGPHFQPPKLGDGVEPSTTDTTDLVGGADR